MTWHRAARSQVARGSAGRGPSATAQGKRAPPLQRIFCRMDGRRSGRPALRCEVAQGDEEEPGRAGEEGDVEAGDPPSRDQDAEEASEAEEGTPGARGGEAEDIFSGAGSGTAKG